MSKPFRLKRILHEAEEVFDGLERAAEASGLSLDTITIYAYPVETGIGRRNGGYAFCNHKDKRVVFVIASQPGIYDGKMAVFRWKGMSGGSIIWVWDNLPERVLRSPLLCDDSEQVVEAITTFLLTSDSENAGVDGGNR